jgi:hypothetical protein
MVYKKSRQLICRDVNIIIKLFLNINCICASVSFNSRLKRDMSAHPSTPLILRLRSSFDSAHPSTPLILRLRSGCCKILMKIRDRFYSFIKISEVKFFIGAVQVITVEAKTHQYHFTVQFFFK